MARTAPKKKDNFFLRSIRRFPGLLRVGLFLVAVWAGLAYLATRKAEAEVREMMLGMGAELMRFPGSTQGVERDVEFNGAVVHMMEGSVNRPVNEVLDYFEARCMELDRSHERLLELQQEGFLGEGDLTLSDSVMRHDYGPTAFVACLDPGEEHDNGDPDSIGDRLSAFLESGDLADVGALRYVYVERHQDDGGEEMSQIVSLYTDGPVNIYDMFPTAGDAAGADVDDVPRPPGSRRILSSRVVGRPYGVTMYASETSSAEDLDRYYRAALPELGWAEIASHEGERVTVDGMKLYTVSKGERIVTVALSEEEGVTSTTILVSDEAP